MEPTYNPPNSTKKEMSMPTIVFNPGDVFKYGIGFRLVLASGSMYLLAEGGGGHTDHTLRRTAMLLNNAHPNFQ